MTFLWLNLSFIRNLFHPFQFSFNFENMTNLYSFNWGRRTFEPKFIKIQASGDHNKIDFYNRHFWNMNHCILNFLAKTYTHIEQFFLRNKRRKIIMEFFDFIIMQ